MHWHKVVARLAILGALACLLTLVVGLTSAMAAVGPVSHQVAVVPQGLDAEPAYPILPPEPVATQLPDEGEEEDEEEEDEPIEPGEICLGLHTEPFGAAKPDQVVTYHLVVSNDSSKPLKYPQISFPFDPELQTLLDISFSDDRGMVTALQTNTVTMQLETLPNDEQITATLRLRISPDAPLNTLLVAQARVPWGATAPGGFLRSNRVGLHVADEADENDIAPLTLERGPPESTTVRAAYDGFAPLEHVSLWYDHPNGNSVELFETTADAQGRVSALIDLGEPARGQYRLVAYGQCSEVTATAPLSFFSEPAAVTTAEPTAAPATPVDEPEEES